MKVRKDLIGKTIHIGTQSYLVSEDERFITIATNLGLDVFEKIKPKKEKRKEVREDIEKDLESSGDNQAE